MGPRGRRRTRRRTAAVVGGAAYAAGKKSGNNNSDDSVAETPAKAGSDPMEALEKLGQLHQQGVLTDEEFAAKKTEILKDI